jgi:hypothetical protein
MVSNIGPVNECETRSAVIPFVGIIIRKEYELRQQSHFVFISRRVATKKTSSEPVPILTDKYNISNKPSGYRNIQWGMLERRNWL